MIQIGSLRTWTQKDGTESKPFFKVVPKFVYQNLKQLFDNVEADIPKFLGENERYNLFYTVGHHLEGKRQKSSWQCQEIIPFDLDGINLERIDEYCDIVAEVAGFDLSKCGVVYSGNGVHLLVQVPQFGADDKEYIHSRRKDYKHLCTKIAKTLEARGLPIDQDTTCWDYGRILRLPFTVNKKIKEIDGEKVEVVKKCELIQGSIEAQDWAIPVLEKPKEGKALKHGSFPLPDAKTVASECPFFRWLKEKPDEVHEPHAYAMLSITGNFSQDDQSIGKSLYDAFSSPSINSKPYEEFLEQATRASGPRTCEGISDIWNGCTSCPHYKKLKSPILLKSKDYIGTETMGFSTQTLTRNGGTSVKRHYEDLRLWYKREKKYIHIPNRRSTIMEFNGKFFEEVSESEIKAVAQREFKPLVEDDKIRTQFLNQVKSAPDSIKSDSFLHAHKENLINLNNGVLDLTKGELVEHDTKYGFTACMDYDFDIDATCPNWDAFVKAAMRGNQDLINLLEEMLAFTISGMSYNKFQFYFLLVGKGFNGKSTFITLLQRMLGVGNYTAHPLEDLIDKQDARAELATSLANLVADSSASALKGKDLTRLKSWTGNDAVTGRALYKDSISFVNRSKFIFGFNDYPEIKATSVGDERRIKAIPFNADFMGVDKGFFIKDLENKLKQERSGILNRVITAHKRLLEKGFSHCEELDEMKNSIRKSADGVYDFVTDHIYYKEGSKVFLSELYIKYSENKDYSSERYAKEPRRFNKEVRNIIGTNKTFDAMHVKKIRLGERSAIGIENAALTVQSDF